MEKEEFDFNYSDYVTIGLICIAMDKYEKGELTLCSEFCFYVALDLLTKDKNN